MAKLEEKLPRYCVIRQRKGYAVVYFSVPTKHRPAGWKPTYEIGRTDKHSIDEIVAKGNEFYADFKGARKAQDLQLPRARPGSLAALILRYKESEHWTGLKPTTQHNYQHLLDVIRDWSEASGHPHIGKMTTAGIVQFLNRWKETPRMRKYYKAVLSKLFQVAIDEGMIGKNLVREIKLPKAAGRKRKLRIWTPTDIDTFAAKADEMDLFNVGTAVIVAWESFRMTDVFTMQEHRDLKDGCFVINASKTGEPIRIRASTRTIQRLGNKPKEQLLLTVNDTTKRTWTKDAFNKQFRKVSEKAGLSGYVFRQIRNSAAIFALQADLNDGEFQQRFGWTKDDVRAMRDLYTDKNQKIIDRGADKLAEYEKSGQWKS